MADIRCIIVDDEPVARDILQQYVEDTPGLELAGECSNALELLQLLKQTAADLILLDINMPKLSGIDLLKSKTINQQVILTTAYAEYALDGFDLNVTDYLLKPISFSRFLQAIEKVKVKEEDKDFSFSVKAEGKTYRIEVGKIRYVESKGDYVQIHLEDDKVMVYMSMKKMLELCRNRLCRVHKSYAVAISQVKFVEGNIIKIGETEIPIGASYKERFFKLLA